MKMCLVLNNVQRLLSIASTPDSDDGGPNAVSSEFAGSSSSSSTSMRHHLSFSFFSSFFFHNYLLEKGKGGKKNTKPINSPSSTFFNPEIRYVQR